MESLSTTKWVMTWLCMYPPSESSSTRKKAAYKVMCAIVFTIDLCSVIVCIAFIWKYMLTDMAASLFALLGAVTFNSSLYSISIAIFMSHHARIIFEKLSAIYEASK